MAVDHTRFICLGISVLDHIWSVPRIADGPTKVLASGFKLAGGGMAATAAVTIARLGGHVSFWGRAGDDPAGHAMHRELAEEGVDVTHYRRFTGGTSPVASVVVDESGERMITTFRGAGLPSDSGWLPLDAVSGAAAVLADMRWIEGAAALFAAARAHDVPTVLDADIADPDEYGALLPLADYAIFSRPGLSVFAPGVAAEEGLAAARATGCRLAGVTDGARGIVWADETGTAFTPALATQAVDTVGAGDVFHGAFAFAIGNGQAVADAMVFAAIAAGIKCREPGPRAGIPTLNDIQRELENVL